MYNIGSIKHDEIKHNRHIRGDTTNNMTCVYVGCPRIGLNPAHMVTVYLFLGYCIVDKSIYICHSHHERIWKVNHKELSHRSRTVGNLTRWKLGGWNWQVPPVDVCSQMFLFPRFQEKWGEPPSLEWLKFGQNMLKPSKIFVSPVVISGSASKECFDPVMNSWKEVSPMRAPRMRAAAAAVSD
jgi:hypothetical protein